MPSNCAWRPGGRSSRRRGEEGVSTLALGRAAALPGPIGPFASSCLSGGFVDLGYLAVVL
jgi:hypothetical protein